MANANEIVVEVRGGVVQAVYSKENLAVDILDWDNFNAATDPAEKEKYSEIEKAANKMKQVY